LWLAESRSTGSFSSSDLVAFFLRIQFLCTQSFKEICMRCRSTIAACLFTGFLCLTFWIVQAAVYEVPALESVGPTEDGGWIMPTGHKVRSAGQTIAFPGRPVNLALSKNGTVLYVKDNKHIRVIGTEDFKIRQALPFPLKEGASMHGLALSHDGKR